LCKLAASGAVRPDERVVALVTGHGLKTVEALAASGAAASGPTATIAPTLAAFDTALAYEPDTDTEEPTR
jgi:threonine synthase